MLTGISMLLSFVPLHTPTLHTYTRFKSKWDHALAARCSGHRFRNWIRTQKIVGSNLGLASWSLNIALQFFET
jgi:hypothetical protein